MKPLEIRYAWFLDCDNSLNSQKGKCSSLQERGQQSSSRVLIQLLHLLDLQTKIFLYAASNEADVTLLFHTHRNKTVRALLIQGNKSDLYSDNSSYNSRCSLLTSFLNTVRVWKAFLAVSVPVYTLAISTPLRLKVEMLQLGHEHKERFMIFRKKSTINTKSMLTNSGRGLFDQNMKQVEGYMGGWLM